MMLQSAVMVLVAVVRSVPCDGTVIGASVHCDGTVRGDGTVRSGDNSKIYNIDILTIKAKC